MVSAAPISPRSVASHAPLDSPTSSVIVHSTPPRGAAEHKSSSDNDIDDSPSFASSRSPKTPSKGSSSSLLNTSSPTTSDTTSSTPSHSHDTSTTQDSSFEVIIDSKSPDWFRNPSHTEKNHDLDAEKEVTALNAERSSPLSSKQSRHQHNGEIAANSLSNFEKTRINNINALQELPSSLSPIVSADGPIETESTRRRDTSSHSGTHARKRSSVSPMLEPIPDDTASEAMASVILDPSALSFEPGHSSMKSPKDFDSEDSVEQLIQHGKNEQGELTKEARRALAQRGLSLIPSMHGPLSLPYARCPSGIDAYLFSIDKEEDPWTFTFDTENGSTRRGARLTSGTRHAQVPLPGNARYSHSIQPLHTRLGLRAVSAPAEMGPTYTEAGPPGRVEPVPKQLTESRDETNKTLESERRTPSHQANKMETEAMERDLPRTNHRAGTNQPGSSNPSNMSPVYNASSMPSHLPQQSIAQSTYAVTAPTQLPLEQHSSLPMSSLQAYYQQGVSRQAAQSQNSNYFPHGQTSLSAHSPLQWAYAPPSPANAGAPSWQAANSGYVFPFELPAPPTAHLPLPPLMGGYGSTGMSVGLPNRVQLSPMIMSPPMASLVMPNSQPFHDPAIITAEHGGRTRSKNAYQSMNQLYSNHSDASSMPSPGARRRAELASPRTVEVPRPETHPQARDIRSSSSKNPDTHSYDDELVWQDQNIWSDAPMAPRRPSIPLPLAPVRSLVAERRNSAAPGIVEMRKSSLAVDMDATPRRSSVAPQTRLLRENTPLSSTTAYLMGAASEVSHGRAAAPVTHGEVISSSSSSSSKATPRAGSPNYRHSRRKKEGNEHRSIKGESSKIARNRTIDGQARASIVGPAPRHAPTTKGQHQISTSGDTISEPEKDQDAPTSKRPSGGRSNRGRNNGRSTRKVNA